MSDSYNSLKKYIINGTIKLPKCHINFPYRPSKDEKEIYQVMIDSLLSSSESSPA